MNAQTANYSGDLNTGRVQYSNGEKRGHIPNDPNLEHHPETACFCPVFE